MRARYPLLLTLGLASAAMAQDTHVLQHIAPENATETPDLWGQTSQGVPLWGYLVGHNIYGDEAFGEKYEMEGMGNVLGVIAYLGGSSLSEEMASYKIYSVAGNGLPGTELAEAGFTLGQVTTDGQTPHMIMFDNAVAVEDEFFVVLDLDDYSHDGLSGDTISLMSGPHGSRPASDDAFGRNVVRWHNDKIEDWKDFFTQNFTPISTYFAIYPIMAGPAGISSAGSLGMDIAFHPLPFAHELNITLTAIENAPLRLHLFSSDGRLLLTEQHSVFQGEQRLRLDTSGLPSGNYVIALEQGAARYAQLIVK